MLARFLTIQVEAPKTTPSLRSRLNRRVTAIQRDVGGSITLVRVHSTPCRAVRPFVNTPAHNAPEDTHDEVVIIVNARARQTNKLTLFIIRLLWKLFGYKI